jgi:hypothetical protein
MNWLLDPNDWLGRHEEVCLGLTALLILIGGSL